MSRRILVVDDDPHIREVIRFALEKAGMAVLEAADGVQGLQVVEGQRPDLVVLDIVMPEMDGLAMCRELRKTSDLPILFLSSRDDELDRIIGLEIGGDDYVTKPFSPRELVARVNVILRHFDRAAKPEASAAKVYSHGSLRLEMDSRCVSFNEQSIVLTATEFNLLEILLRHPVRVYTRDDLIDSGVFSDVVSDRTVDSHIRRLRAKAAEAGCAAVVETVHGVGYKLGDCQ